MGFHQVSWAYENMISNPVAAFPSLHAAYPVLAALFLWSYSKRAALGMLLYAGVVWFAIMYLGHHRAIDGIGGIVLAVATYVIVARLWWIPRKPLAVRGPRRQARSGPNRHCA
jgi:membrane-associated phospholipid phosphatase